MEWKKKWEIYSEIKIEEEKAIKPNFIIFFRVHVLFMQTSLLTPKALECFASKLNNKCHHCFSLITRLLYNIYNFCYNRDINHSKPCLDQDNNSNDMQAKALIIKQNLVSQNWCIALYKNIWQTFLSRKFELWIQLIFASIKRLFKRRILLTHG